MSTASGSKGRITPADIRDGKGKAPLVCLTAYTTPIARLADAACDLLLVGDSLGMVVHGLPSTIGVTMEMMILHGQAVARGSHHACLVVDMPFGSYEKSPEQAFGNAVRLLAETGCQAVKLEGGCWVAPTIAFLVQRGIPVMAHIGLMPQSVNMHGGYKLQGLGDEAEGIVQDAHAVAGAGAFAVVLEKLPSDLGWQITRDITIPTIGIGAGVDCDGQILVIDDMLGLFADFRPKFVKRYAGLAVDVQAAVAAYAGDVRAGRFPDAAHSYGPGGKPA